MAFVANLFNTHPALKKVDVDEDLIGKHHFVRTVKVYCISKYLKNFFGSRHCYACSLIKPDIKTRGKWPAFIALMTSK